MVSNGHVLSVGFCIAFGDRSRSAVNCENSVNVEYRRTLHVGCDADCGIAVADTVVKGRTPNARRSCAVSGLEITECRTNRSSDVPNLAVRVIEQHVVVRLTRVHDLEEPSLEERHDD